jgi:hypothetical protein
VQFNHQNQLGNRCKSNSLSIWLFGTNPNVIREVKDYLSNSFKMKVLGEVYVILIIKLLREGNGGDT